MIATVVRYCVVCSQKDHLGDDETWGDGHWNRTVLCGRTLYCSRTDSTVCGMCGRTTVNRVLSGKPMSYVCVRVIGSNSRCVKADIIPQHLPSADLANVRSVDEACSVSTMNRTRPKQEQSTSLQPCVAGCGGGGKRSDVK